MDEIEEKTCVRFYKARETDHDRIRIIPLGCAYSIGRQGGTQNLTLDRGCSTNGQILRRLMFILGFIPEHSREPW